MFNPIEEFLCGCETIQQNRFQGRAWLFRFTKDLVKNTQKSPESGYNRANNVRCILFCQLEKSLIIIK